MNKNVFPKGSYIVLLSSCTGDDNWAPIIPEGYVYRLTEDSSEYSFNIEKDCSGRGNGWTLTKNADDKEKYDHFLLRAAFPEEIVRYEAAIGPVECMKELTYQIF